MVNTTTDLPTLHVEEAGTGDPVVFLPGFSVGFADYEPIRARLADGYRVLSIDLPGSGRSGPQPRDFRATYYQDDAETIATLIRSWASEPVHLVGHSDGGEVALLIAALHADLARSVVVWGAAGHLNDSHRGIVEFFNAIIDNPTSESAPYRAQLIAAYGEEGARLTTKSFAGAIASIIAKGGDISLSKAHQIRCSTLLITGEDDAFAPPALVEAYAKRVPTAETEVAKGAGHDVHETHAGWFERRVFDWLKALGDTSGRRFLY